MYWQQRFNRKNPDKQIEEEMIKIHQEHKNYGYRRMNQELIILIKGKCKDFLENK